MKGDAIMSNRRLLLSLDNGGIIDDGQWHEMEKLYFKGSKYFKQILFTKNTDGMSLVLKKDQFHFGVTPISNTAPANIEWRLGTEGDAASGGPERCVLRVERIDSGNSNNNSTYKTIYQHWDNFQGFPGSLNYIDPDEETEQNGIVYNDLEVTNYTGTLAFRVVVNSTKDIWIIPPRLLDKKNNDYYILLYNLSENPCYMYANKDKTSCFYDSPHFISYYKQANILICK